MRRVGPALAPQVAEELGGRVLALVERGAAPRPRGQLVEVEEAVASVLVDEQREFHRLHRPVVVVGHEEHVVDRGVRGQRPADRRVAALVVERGELDRGSPGQLLVGDDLHRGQALEGGGQPLRGDDHRPVDEGHEVAHVGPAAGEHLRPDRERHELHAPLSLARRLDGIVHAGRRAIRSSARPAPPVDPRAGTTRSRRRR